MEKFGFAIVDGREVFRDPSGQLIDAVSGEVLDGELLEKAERLFARRDGKRRFSEALARRNDPLAGEVFERMKKGIEAGDFDPEELDSDPNVFSETFDKLKASVLEERRKAAVKACEKRARELQREARQRTPETLGGRQSNFQKYVELLEMSQEFGAGMGEDENA